ncbi:USP20 family protein [Megaselia abdita]
MSTKCRHIESVAPASIRLLLEEKSVNKCSVCENGGPNLWICLENNCMSVGCSENHLDHSTMHFQFTKMNRTKQSIHSIHMNLSSRRIWCYLCEAEVFLKREKTPNSLIAPTSSEFEEDNFQGLVGLRNIANTCYMNSALQALCHIPELSKYFLDFDDMIESSVEKLPLTKAYCKFIKEIWEQSSDDGRRFSSIIPKSVLNNIRAVYPMFRGFQQHDTQEFLRCFMDQLHEELKVTFPSSKGTVMPSQYEHCKGDADGQSICSSISPSQSEAEYETCDSGVSEPSSLFDEFREIPPTNQPSDSKSTDKSNKSNTSQTTNGPGPKSIISDVFDGKLLSSVQCLTCDRVSCKEETFQDLSLPIPNKDHLAVLHKSATTSPISNIPRALSFTTAFYKLSFESWFMWFWNLIRSWFWGPSISLEDCLTSFFSADELKGDNMYSCDRCQKLRNGIKFSKVVELPEILCIHLKRFRHDLSFSSKISSSICFPMKDLDMKAYVQKDKELAGGTIYNLVSVICHHGTVGGGHYTSFAKHDVSGKWYEFDDQHVTPVPEETVQNCQAYVLFYRKCNRNIMKAQSEAQDILDLSINEESVPIDRQCNISRQWLHRFQTFADPGPIDNWSFLCPHGDIHPNDLVRVDQMAVPLPSKVWEFLQKRFGGGPVLPSLNECEVCKKELVRRERRRQCEYNTFKMFNDKFNNEESRNEDALYAISMDWYRKWEAFVHGTTDEEPGPIENKPIAVATEQGYPKRLVRHGADFAQINTALWDFFHNIYGGGPEILLREAPVAITEMDDDEDDTIVSGLLLPHFENMTKFYLSSTYQPISA